MTAALAGLRVGLLERRHPPGHRGSLVERLVPLLRAEGARVEVVHAEEGWHPLTVAPTWDVAVLKSGSAAALHLAGAAEAWGVPCLNPSGATRLAQDKLASAAILQRAGLPIAPSPSAWLGPDAAGSPPLAEALAALGERRLVVKVARGSRGVGLWTVEPAHLTTWAAEARPGPYLLMDWVPHRGDDLKVFVAGDWMAAIERPFPARTLIDKQGRPATIPEEVETATRAVGRVLGLTCFGCDFVAGPGGWTLVDANAFPGYKGAPAAAEAIAHEIGRTAAEGGVG